MFAALRVCALFSDSELHARLSFVFFFNDPATTELYTLSLHDALPISAPVLVEHFQKLNLPNLTVVSPDAGGVERADRKSTRLNSSHEWISYAVFCLKKKKNQEKLEELPEAHKTQGLNVQQRDMQHARI